MQLEAELLKTLSFYEPMSMEYILIDLSKEFTLENPHLTTEDLEQSLRRLRKQGKVKRIKQGKDVFWQKTFPKRSWFRSIKSWFY